MRTQTHSLPPHEGKALACLRRFGVALAALSLSGCITLGSVFSRPAPQGPGPVRGTATPTELAKPETTAPEPPPPAPVDVKLEKDNLTGMEFVQIKGGCFNMGSPAGEKDHQAYEKQHQVCVGDFALGRTEVTNAQFRRFKSGHDSSQYKGISFNSDNQPVVNVDWNDAVAYAVWLSKETGKKYRLPTEAEWEYAARAGTQTARFWGNSPDGACPYANVHDKTSKQIDTDAAWKGHNCADGRAMTAVVGSYKPNPWGLQDMLGNVWEWTCSAYDPKYGGGERECAGKDDANYNRALRGGSWLNEPRAVRTAYRINLSPSYRYSNIGFRLLLEGGDQLARGAAPR